MISIERKYSSIENQILRNELISKEVKKVFVKESFDLEDTKNKLRELSGKNKIRPFFPWKLFFVEVFAEKGGFDIVLGNPPYIQIKGIPTDSRRFYESRYRFATGRFNVFYLFIEKATVLSRENGIISFIVPDRLLLNTQCGKLRQWLLNDNQIQEIVSFNDQVFETAVVDSIILEFENHPNQSDYITAKVKVSPIKIRNMPNIKIPLSYITLSPSSQIDLNYSLIKSHLIEKVLLKSVPLVTISESKDGIIQSKIGDELFIKKGVNPHCRKLLVGENVNRYLINYDQWFVNYQPKEMMKLEQQKGGNGLRLREKRIFERPKILTRQTADEIIAAFDEDNNYYYANTLHGTAIIDNNYHPYYVLGILNSKFTTWFYRSNTDEKGKVFAQIKIELLRRLPIPKIDLNGQDPIIQTVTQILAVRSRNLSVNTKLLEDQIDKLVYKLYELTDEEIALVEGSITHDRETTLDKREDVSGTLAV